MAIRTNTTSSRHESFNVDGYLFDVFKEREGFFNGGTFAPCTMAIEKLEDWRVWQVTIISAEAYEAKRKPEEVFLLENVEQILCCDDRRMDRRGFRNRNRIPTASINQADAKYQVMFCLRGFPGNQQSIVSVVFPNKDQLVNF